MNRRLKVAGLALVLIVVPGSAILYGVYLIGKLIKKGKDGLPRS